jgi:hypothetical protein
MKRRLPPSQRQTPLSAQDAIRHVTKMQVAMGRQIGGDDDDKIRADIKTAFNEAVVGEEEYSIPVEMPDGQVETCINAAGMFRTVFKIHGLDRKDPWSQERWWTIVEEAMNWALAQHDGDYKRKAV